MERLVARSSDGSPIYFDVDGEGRPIVFVHGWSCDRTYWRNQLPWFARDHRAVAVDLAGHGESGTGRTAWTMAAFGADVAAVLEMLDLRNAVLVGHSMGGDVIVETGRLVPDRVSGLIWVDTYSTLGKPGTRAEHEAFMRPFRSDFGPYVREFVRGMFPPGSDPALVEAVAADMAAAPPEIAIDAMDYSISNDGPVLDGLRAVAAPLISINPGTRPTDVAAMKRHGVSGVEIMPNVGHFPMLEAPGAFNELLAATIRQLPAATRV